VNLKRKHGFLSIHAGLSAFYRPGSEILKLLGDNFQKSFLVLLINPPCKPAPPGAEFVF
jgi:hypothetical protein